MDKILIVVDMQNDFIDGILGTQEAQDIIPNVWDKIKNWDDTHILYTMDSHMYPFYIAMTEGKIVPPHCEIDTKGWQINPFIWNALIEFGLEHEIKQIEKDTFIGFEIESYINEEIQPKNPFEIHLVGLCTDICVISNVMIIKVLFPNAKIIVKESCCAGVDKQGHDEALRAMQRCHIEII